MTDQPPRRSMNFGGVDFEILADPNLEPDVLELRAPDGRVYSSHKIATVAVDPVIRGYIARMLGPGGAEPYAAPLGVATVGAVEPSRFPNGPVTITRAQVGFPPIPVEEAEALATAFVGDADGRVIPESAFDEVPADVVERIRRRIEEEVSRFIITPAQATFDAILDEALRDAVTVGSGFIRIDYSPVMGATDQRGDWTISRVDPTTVEIREERS